jgi:hypothetical protein
VSIVHDFGEKNKGSGRIFCKKSERGNLLAAEGPTDPLLFPIAGKTAGFFRKKVLS